MKFAANNPVRFVLFALLLLYATTADFMATSLIFVDGHDCDHPWVRIEHKCVTDSAGTKQAQAAVSHVDAHAQVAFLAIGVSALSPVWPHGRVATTSSLSAGVDLSFSTNEPLRC
jgi:hypothetical protein